MDGVRVDEGSGAGVGLVGEGAEGMGGGEGWGGRCVS